VRLAWFTPWPPDRSGIAGRSAELVPRLAARGHGIDVYVDERRVPVARAADDAPPPGRVRVQSAHDFVWRAARHQYDLSVYQLGNSRLHEFIWPYLFRWPGLAVLHDGRLHHARGRALLSRDRENDYRAEFAWNHPQVPADAAELAIAGFDGPYYYQWPMTRGVVESSRLVAAHSMGAVHEISAAWPHRPVEYVALGEGRATPVSEDERIAARQDLGLADDAVLFGVFGRLSAEKRIAQILHAFATTSARSPQARLLLAGTPDRAVDISAIARALGIQDAVVVAADPSDDGFDRLIAAVDVSLNLRWPTALETSGPWLRALAAGRPTVIIDLAHLANLVTLDPRTWQPHARGPAGGRGVEPIAVAIDVLDEDHSLRLAMHRLAADAGLRTRLGRAGRAWWEAEHTVERMVADYERVLERAAATSAPRSERPAHVTPDPAAHAAGLAGTIDPGLVTGLHVQSGDVKER
jgi:glycosyltransferase involved in cell wall biosynthesis